MVLIARFRFDLGVTSCVNNDASDVGSCRDRFPRDVGVIGRRTERLVVGVLGAIASSRVEGNATARGVCRDG